MNRTIIAVIGIVSALAGVLLRLNAYDLAWPASFSYSGSRTDTIWYIREQAYKDISLMLVAFGLLVLLVVLASWLWPREAAGVTFWSAVRKRSLPALLTPLCASTSWRTPG